MITVADVGGPQEFILGGAVVQLEDYERFMPGAMGEWFRRRILGKRTRSGTPESLNVRDASTGATSRSGEVQARAMQRDVVRRLQHAMEVLEEEPVPEEQDQNTEAGQAGGNAPGDGECPNQ
jgi:hypothetical protein